jgi:hypothetical protein
LDFGDLRGFALIVLPGYSDFSDHGQDAIAAINLSKENGYPGNVRY